MKGIRRKVTMAVAVPAALALTLGLPTLAFASTPSHGTASSGGGISIGSDHHGSGLSLGVVLGLNLSLGSHGGWWHDSCDENWGGGILGL